MKLTSAHLYISGLLLCATIACKKSDPSPSVTGGGRIIKISASSQSFDSSTTYIVYNADGSINYADQTDGFGNTTRTTYNYLNNLTVITAGAPGTTGADYKVDSIVYGANGLATYASSRIALYASYDNTHQFFYNGAGQLTTTIFSFPNIGQVDTVHHVWLNGDMISQSSRLGTLDMTYAYDLSQRGATGIYPIWMHSCQRGSHSSQMRICSQP